MSQGAKLAKAKEKKQAERKGEDNEHVTADERVQSGV
jgi:hypothetical protein